MTPLRHAGRRYPTTLFLAAVLALAAWAGFATLAGPPRADALGRPAEPIATADPYSAGVEGFDHSGIAPASPDEPDTTGASVAAYGN
jgi:hypothetical protein